MPRIVKKAAERREEIIRTARDLFLANEYDKTTMHDVMKRLKIAKGTIYHYFESKEALLEAVVVDMIDTRLSEIMNSLNGSTEDALAKIRMLIDRSNMEIGHKALQDSLHRPANAALHVRLLAETINKLAPIYENIIRQGCTEGVFYTEHPRECAEFILSAVQFLLDTGVYHWSPRDLNRRTRAFPGLIEQQLKAPAGSFDFLLPNS